MANRGTPPLVTVFGGGGFIGRYVCEALLKAGARVRVAERDPRRAWFLQPLGGVGQVSAIAADLARPATVDRGGRGRRRGHQPGRHASRATSTRIHVDGAGKRGRRGQGGRRPGLRPCQRDRRRPRRRVRLWPDQGRWASRRCAPPSPRRRSSARASCSAPEDEFTNRFASMARFPVLPVIAPRTRFQPVYVRDLGQAIAAAALDPKTHGGKTYELAGPEVMTMRELNAEVAANGRPRPRPGRRARFRRERHVAASASCPARR